MHKRKDVKLLEKILNALELVVCIPFEAVGYIFLGKKRLSSYVKLVDKLLESY